MKVIMAIGFFMFSFFYMIFVLGGIVSTLGENETALQRIIFTSILFIVATLLLGSGVGVLLKAKWSRISGMVAAVMGAIWCCVYTIIYKTPIDLFLIIQVTTLLCFAYFLTRSKVKI